MRSSNTAKAAGWLGFGALLAVVCTVSLITLGQRFSKRWDVTATRDNGLHQRTISLLSGMQQPHQVAIWGDFNTLDANAKRSVLDTIELFSRSSSKVTFTRIDVGDASGKAQFTQFVRELAANETSSIKDYATIAKGVIDATGRFGRELTDVVGPAMDDLAKAFSPATREAASRRAAAVRAAGQNLSDLAARASKELDADTLGAGIPELSAQAVARPVRDSLRTALEQFGKFSSELSSVGEAAGASDELILATRGVVRGINDAIGRASESLSTFQRARAPSVVRVVDALKAPRGVLLLGPEEPGLLALDFDELFSPGSRADARRRAEDLLATGLASLSSPIRPIAVFTHAESQSVLDQGRLFETLLSKLTLRNFEVVEWPVLSSDLPPGFQDLRGTAIRPVVYIIISPDSSASGGGTGGALPGAQRAQALGKVIARLVNDGASFLISLNPSVLPSAGQVDPITAPLASAGLKVDTARPILTRIVGSGGTATISPDSVAIAPANSDATAPGHQVANAISNLRTFVGFPMVITADSSTQGTPLLTVPVTDNTWCESQWLAVWQTPAQQRSMLQPIPAFDASKDARPDSMVIARSVEREHAGSVQRIIAVGSNNWMADFVLNQRTNVDGRDIAEFPGNTELLDSSLLWLSRQDQLLTGSSISPVALVDPLTFGQLRMLRLATLVGMPLMVLGCGILYRWIRG